MKEKLINKLFLLSTKSLAINDFPVAAIIYAKDGHIISTAYNKRNKTNKTTDHAEIIAIEKANKKLNTWKLQEYYMIVTLEPCDMCKTVIKESRLKKIEYLIPRYKYKKQYKCTDFQIIEYEGPDKEKYIQNIKHFFDNKK